MKTYIYIPLITIFISCNNISNKSSYVPKYPKWENRYCDLPVNNDLNYGKSYLPLYSHIYHRFENSTHNLTTTVSIRNISTIDTIFIHKADYYNTTGENIRQYIGRTILVKPLETIEIIIESDDNEGGSGANFLFEWSTKNPLNIPLFEAVMISTDYQQGLSFTSRGVLIHE